MAAWRCWSLEHLFERRFLCQDIVEPLFEAVSVLRYATRSVESRKSSQNRHFGAHGYYMPSSNAKLASQVVISLRGESMWCVEFGLRI